MKALVTYLILTLCSFSIFGQDSTDVVILTESPVDTIVEGTSPFPEKLIAALSKSGDLTLDWKYEGLDSLGFLVYISRSKNSDFSLLTPDTLQTKEWKDFIKQGPTPKKYYFKVEALSTDSMAPYYSNVASVVTHDIVAPDIPDFHSLDLIQKGMFLQWENLSEDVEYINILRKDGEFNEPEIIKIDNPRSGTFIDETCESGKWYFYSLVAVDNSGNESKESRVIRMYAEDMQPKDGAYNITAEKTEFGELKLTWEVKNSTAFKFEIFRSVNGKGYELHQKILAGRNMFFDSQVKKKKTYSYQIRTIYSDGTLSPLSEEIAFEFK